MASSHKPQIRVSCFISRLFVIIDFQGKKIDLAHSHKWVRFNLGLQVP